MTKRQDKIYHIDNYLTFELTTLFKINPEDLGLYPQFMSEDRLKEIIVNEIDFLFRNFLEQQYIRPVSYEVKLIGADNFSKQINKIEGNK